MQFDNDPVRVFCTTVFQPCTAQRVSRVVRCRGRTLQRRVVEISILAQLMKAPWVRPTPRLTLNPRPVLAKTPLRRPNPPANPRT